MPCLLELADNVKFLFTGVVYEPVDLATLSRTKEVDARFHIIGDRWDGKVVRRYESDCCIGAILRRGFWEHEEPYERSEGITREEIVRGQWYAHARVSASFRRLGCEVQHHADEDTQRVLDRYLLRLDIL